MHYRRAEPVPEQLSLTSISRKFSAHKKIKTLVNNVCRTKRLNQTTVISSLKSVSVFALDNEKVFKRMTMNIFHEFIIDKNNDVGYVILYNLPYGIFPTELSYQ